MTLDAAELPRLLAGLAAGAKPLDLDAHRAIFGDTLPITRRTLSRAREQLIAEIGRAGLTGKGGGSFPTARKLRAVADRGGTPAVVVTATEGEPLSRKDRLLATRAPHLVLDGALTVAAALGARRIVLAHDRLHLGVGGRLRAAAASRPELAVRGAPDLTVQAVPDGYLSGQETALVAALNGRRAVPAFTPPYPFERGLGRVPTFVSNIETYAQIALIARYGAAWYRAVGTEQAPGSRLVTVGGAVASPGVVEVPGGVRAAEVLVAAGGLSEPVAALLLGGYGGTWTRVDPAALELDEVRLRATGLTLGPGLVFALPASACPVAEVAAVVRFMAGESAGQCGPCRFGLEAIAGALQDLCADDPRGDEPQQIRRWATMVSGRGACAHPDGVARFAASALTVFAGEVADHARYGRCERCDQPSVLLPSRPSSASSLVDAAGTDAIALGGQ
jgi:NADH:ubiquinone oxidoreductase subunit F (NADH-binding)